MNLLILLAFAVFGFWIVNKLVPGKATRSGSVPDTTPRTLNRPWYEVLELPRNASDAQIEARYQELTAVHNETTINTLEPDLRDEARAIRQEIDTAYHFSKFRR